MEIKILENEKNRLAIEANGIGHTICNVVIKELWNDDAIKNAAYTIDHPLVGVPKIIIETNGDKTPQKALLDAIKRVQKDNETFLELVKENLK